MMDSLCEYSGLNTLKDLARLIELRHRVEGDVKNVTIKDLEPIRNFCRGHRTHRKAKC